MDKRTRAISDATPSTMAIAQRVLEHLEERGTPLPSPTLSSGTRWRKSGLLLLADED